MSYEFERRRRDGEVARCTGGELSRMWKSGNDVERWKGSAEEVGKWIDG